MLESLRLEDGQLARLPQHLARLRRAAQHFGLPLDENQLHASLNALTQQYPTGVHKVRLLVDVAGGVMAEAAPLPNPTGPLRVGIASAPMPQADEFIWHKTTRRDAYQAFKAQPGCFDTLLYNRLGELTEFTIGNVAIHLDGQWITPPVSCGLLPGVMRETLLQSGHLTEGVVTLAALAQATGLALINSVRGWVDVELTLPPQTTQS